MENNDGILQIRFISVTPRLLTGRRVSPVMIRGYILRETSGKTPCNSVNSVVRFFMKHPGRLSPSESITHGLFVKSGKGSWVKLIWKKISPVRKGHY